MCKNPRRTMWRCTAAFVASVSLAGCGTLGSVLPSVSMPHWLGGGSKKLDPLPEIQATVTPRIAWQSTIGKATGGLAPGLAGDAVYVASLEGNIARLEASTGRTVWRISAGKALSAGVGADTTIVAVGTDKGDVLAYNSDGKPVWQAHVSSEVSAPPVIGEEVVTVWSGDGRIFGLNASDGKTKWVHQRINPPLMVRNATSGVISRGGVFTGTPGGKLLALDMRTGTVGWEGSVATPKGATELERIADITSLPVVEDRQACAVAYQGRIACFEVTRGVLQWSRDISSLGGMALDETHYYVTDDKGSVHALDKATGASAWKQDRLAKRRIGGPQMVGRYVGVVDGEGYLHLLDPKEGTIVGRVATDGTPATSQPRRSANTAIWQSEGGNVYAVTAQ